MFDAISLLFTQEFLLRALIVGVMISLCCALLGVSLVLKRFSMIGDGLSHVGFGAMAIACAANVAPLYFSLPIVLVAAFLLLRMNEKGKIKGDAAIALISTGALAVGVMVTSVTTGMNVDIYNYMFGSILTMSNDDVVISTIISAVVSVLFIIFYNEIFTVTFDENFAQATGTKTSVYNILIAGLTAVTIVIGMRMMGALLISSLIIFPAVTSMRICKSFRSVVVSSAFVSVVCFIVGIMFSVIFETPTGASIVCVNICFLLLFSFIGKIQTLIKNKSFRIFLTSVTVIAFASIIVVLPFLNENKISDNKRISIITTGFAEYDFAKQIVKSNGDVSMLLSPGEESHTYEPTPSDILKIQNSDIFICGGGESETWVNKILQSIDSDVTVLRMMDIVPLRENSEHEAEHEHNHYHGEYDEHVWTSPVNAELIVKAIYSEICTKDKINEKYYKNNVENYLSEIQKISNAFAELGENSVGKFVVIGDRFPLRYLMLEYGIDYYSAFPGCSAQVEANPVTISKLNDMIKKDNIPYVFKVDLSNGKVADSISEATGADVGTLYSCHVVSVQDFENGETYLSLMTRNYEALKKALTY